MVAVTVPPEKLAVAFVAGGLASEFSADEMLIVAEDRDVGAPPDDWTGPPVTLIGRLWKRPQRGRRYVLWMRWFGVRRLARKIEAVAREFGATCILAHYPDERYLAASWMVARRLGIPLFPFFHNTYLDTATGFNRWVASWLQPRVFRDAALVFCMSEGMQRAWQREYPGLDVEPLIHTFPGEVPAFEPLPEPRERLQLRYLGSLNASNRDAMSRVVQVVEEEGLELVVHSGVAQWVFERFGLVREGVRFEEASDAELQGKLQQADLLVLPHGFDGGLAPIEYETIFPTRTIPYLLAGRPIVAHAPEDSFLVEWLRRHDCAELVTEKDAEALKAAVRRLGSDAARREELVRNGLAAVAQFQASKVVAALKATLTERCARS